MMTESKQNLVPEIRFSGFTNAWERQKLGEVYKERKERGIDSLPILSVSIHHGVSDEELDGNTLGKEVRRSDDKSLYKRVYAGDLVINMMRAWQGAIGVVKSDGMVSPAYITAIPNSHVYPPFMDFYLRRDESILQMDNLSQGVTDFRKRLYWDSFIDITCHLPSLLEQERISDFFHILNNTITLHKRKLDELVTLKNGFLQQMFPVADEVVPRVRFAGFTGNWEERRLGEMLTERNEQFEESEDYPLMSFVGNVGVVPKGEQYDRSFLVKGDNKKYKRTELNDFIYSSNNLETGSIGFNRTGKAVISPVYSIFYSNNDSESLFVGLLSKRKDFINKMIHYRQGVMYGQWRIHERDFLKIIVLTPTFSEQNRIIDFFKNLDEQIAAQTAKLEQLRQLKAAYLQRMFI
ncbi:restriction endonuclease subunit S [Paenibacillus ferrarius]|uniref:restriction endonuclease subunit S n=1 Tax=Paenibacillus ferrarius TaxID=1469647 RepID=UPI003D2A1779